MTIDNLIAELQKAKEAVGGDTPIYYVTTGWGENDIFEMNYIVKGDFTDQDSENYSCAIIGDHCGEEFTRRGVNHWNWNPKEDRI